MKFCISIILSLVLLTSSVLSTKAWSWSFFDPSFSGCIYNEFSQKIGCSIFKYNQHNDYNSRARAEQLCYAEMSRRAVEDYRLRNGQFKIICSD